MFSREESKRIREDFWIFFGKRYPRKWILYNTKIKDFSLKFSFDTKKATVSIDSESNDPVFRAYYFEKLVNLKKLLEAEVSPEIIFDSEVIFDTNKIVSRCYLELNNVSIHNKNTWPTVFDFFYENMSKIEAFFLEYEDFIKN